jgi:putative membrane protein
MDILITATAVAAAAVHVLIFYWESVAWTRPNVWRRFGVPDQETAEITRPLAYNQGFYNLFLAIGTLLGVILYAVGLVGAGLAIGLFSVSSMVAAALALVSSGRGRVKSALVQATFPLLTIVLVLITLATTVTV